MKKRINKNAAVKAGGMQHVVERLTETGRQTDSHIPGKATHALFNLVQNYYAQH